MALSLKDHIEEQMHTDLPSNTIHVWTKNFGAVQHETERLIHLLNDHEKIRANKFKFPKDRQRFIVSRAVLKVLLGRYLDENPQEIEFEYGAYGKPEVKVPSSVNFNISHAGNMVVLGFVKNYTIGVDVEIVKNDFDVVELAENFFSQDEIRALSNTNENERFRAFYRCWTRKESFIKAVGQGLSYPLDSFAVSLDDDHSAEFLKINGIPDPQKNWRLHSFIPADGYIAALSINGNPKTIQFFDWQREIQL
ncbi:MAG: 4'-phosphopantetheinyl transferase family protein [Aurantibacter sp.]